MSQTGRLGIAKIQQQAATAGPGAIACGALEAGEFTKHSLKMKIARPHFCGLATSASHVMTF